MPSKRSSRVRARGMGRFVRCLWMVPLLLLVALLLGALNARFPLIGSDFRHFLPRLLAGSWHISHQGLAPFRYTPHLGGGMPMYGNPEDVSYSLVQWLSLVLDPWFAVQIAIAVMVCAGYAGWRLVGRDVLGLTPPWTHVLALTIVANGFYLAHMAVGHLTFHTFPLLGWLAWILFDRRKDSVRSLIGKAVLFGLLSAVIFHAGGYFILLLGLVGFALMLPLDIALSAAGPAVRLRTLTPRALCCLAVTLTLCASKLVAVYSFMRFFPREAGLRAFPEDMSILAFMAKAFWAMPQHAALFTGAPWGAHEQTVFLSPVTLLGLVAAIPLVALALYVRRRSVSILTVVNSLLYCLLILVFFTQLTRGFGPLVNLLLENFPFSSLRVSQRFLAVPGILLCMAGVWSLARVLCRLTRREQTVAAALCMGVTLCSFALALRPILPAFDLSYDKNAFDVIADAANAGIAEPVERLELRSTNFASVGGLQSMDELIGDNTVLHAGPVKDITDGAYNLMNPACYQYPDENGCKAGDRILVDDIMNLERFRKGKPVTWKISALQSGADRLSLLALIGAAVTVCVLPIRRRPRGARAHSRSA